MPGKIPQEKYINIATVSQDIDNCIVDFLRINGIENDYKTLVTLKHQTINYMFRYIYKRLFKPDTTLCNNQKSYVNYNDMELMQVLADKFLEICERFNKSLGLISFANMIGCDYSTVSLWVSDKESNPQRFEILQRIREGHKAAQVAILNDSPVGALAVANNDNETGLNWSRQQALEQANNAVFLIPSERVSRLNLEKVE